MFIGIDPGLKGGIAIISETFVQIKEMPINQAKEIDVHKLFEMMPKESIFCVIEQLLPMPGQNSKATTKAGVNYGKLLAVLELAGIPYQEVHPAKWKKEFQLIKKSKAHSCAVAKKLFPQLDFITPRGRLMDGVAEALLMACYAQRIHK